MKSLLLFPFRCLAIPFRILLWLLSVLVAILGVLLPETSRNIREVIAGARNILRF